MFLEFKCSVSTVCVHQVMENVLDTLGEAGSLSPLSANVHDEDFSGLGDHSEVSFLSLTLVYSFIKRDVFLIRQ